MINSQKQTDDYTNYPGTKELFWIEKNLPKYNLDVSKKICLSLSSKNKILEFGAGIGTIARLVKNQLNINIECLEIDLNLREILTSRGFKSYDSIESIHSKFESIYSSNVIEHIKDDISALSSMHKLLVPGGNLILYVPAFQFLFSDLDLSVGHYRRYDKTSLVQKVKKCGFEIESCRYVDSLGFIATLPIKFFGFKDGERFVSEKKLAFFDSFIYPLSNFLDFLGLKYILGKNILLVAKKKI